MLNIERCIWLNSPGTSQHDIMTFRGKHLDQSIADHIVRSIQTTEWWLGIVKHIRNEMNLWVKDERSIKSHSVEYWTLFGGLSCFLCVLFLLPFDIKRIQNKSHKLLTTFSLQLIQHMKTYDDDETFDASVQAFYVFFWMHSTWTSDIISGRNLTNFLFLFFCFFFFWILSHFGLFMR